jgi:four helix bundle protein
MKSVKMQYGFERLRSYQLAEQLCDIIWATVHRWSVAALRNVGEQLIWSSDRVGVDIAEGTGRSTPKDNSRLVDDARGSPYETRHWLRRAYWRKLLTADDIASLQPLMEGLLPKLNAYRNALKRRSESNKPGAPSSRKRPTSNLT